MHCPGCGDDNLAGADLCDTCGTDLAGLDLPSERGGFTGRVLTDVVGALALRAPVIVSRDDTVAEAVRLMGEAREGCAFVVDDGDLVGMLTERHVLSRVAVPGRDPQATGVSEVMSENPRTLDTWQPVAHAMHLMAVEGLHHLPVLDGDRLAGVASARTLLRYLDSVTTTT